MPFAEIAVDAPLEPGRTFTYSIPSGLDAQLGHCVWVPFGRRTLQGIVFEVTDAPAFQETRDVAGLVDPVPLLSPHHLSLARWTSLRYLCSLFEAASVMLPQGVRRRVRTFYSLAPAPWPYSFSPNDSQRKALDTLEKLGRSQLPALRRELGGRAQQRLDSLVRVNVVTREWELPRPSVSAKFETQYYLKADPEHAVALANLQRNAVNQRAFLDALFEQPGRHLCIRAA